LATGNNPKEKIFWNYLFQTDKRISHIQNYLEDIIGEIRLYPPDNSEYGLFLCLSEIDNSKISFSLGLFPVAKSAAFFLFVLQ